MRGCDLGGGDVTRGKFGGSDRPGLMFPTLPVQKRRLLFLAFCCQLSPNLFLPLIHYHYNGMDFLCLCFAISPPPPRAQSPTMCEDHRDLEGASLSAE